MKKAETKRELEIEVVEDREMTADEFDAIALLLARWWIREFEEGIKSSRENSVLSKR